VSGDAVAVRPSGAGCSLRLRVKPAARRARLVGPHGGALKLEVTAAPEKGRANRAVERLLADRLGLDVAAVRIVAGESSQDKAVAIDSPAEAVAAALRGVGVEARVD